jgi:hypothetical protein
MGLNSKSRYDIFFNYIHGKRKILYTHDVIYYLICEMNGDTLFLHNVKVHNFAVHNIWRFDTKFARKTDVLL